MKFVYLVKLLSKCSATSGPENPENACRFGLTVVAYKKCVSQSSCEKNEN